MPRDNNTYVDLHIGQYIRAMALEKAINWNALLTMIGRDKRWFEGIVKGNRYLTYRECVILGEVFSTGAGYWVDKQNELLQTVKTFNGHRLWGFMNKVTGEFYTTSNGMRSFTSPDRALESFRRSCPKSKRYVYTFVEFYPVNLGVKEIEQLGDM